MRVRSTLARTVLTGGLALAWGPAPGISAQEGFTWRPEDRVILTSFHLVSGMARDERRLYAASEGGLQVVDLFSGGWEDPSTAEDGYPVDEGPTAATYDPTDRVVWLGTVAGNLHAYQTDFQRWRLEAAPGVGPVLALTPATLEGDEGVLMRTPTGWYHVSRFGGVRPVPPDRIPPGAQIEALPPEERLSRLEPAYGAARSTLTVDGAGRAWPLTDFVKGDRPSEYWLGTAGNNLYRYDARFYEAESRPFGLLTGGSAALAEDGPWIWIGGDGRGPRRGPVRARWNLQEWQQFESGVVPAPPEFVEDIHVGEEAVWLASVSGLYRFDRGGGTWQQVGGVLGRTPIRRVVPAVDGGLWAAAERGLVRVAPDGTPGDVFFQGRAVRAVLDAAGGVWLGGDVGLLQMDREGRIQGLPPGASPPPQGPIVDLVSDRGTLWGATSDALWRYDGLEWEGPLREVTGSVGRIVRLRVTGDALWVVGRTGVARRTADGSGWTYLIVGRDLPESLVADVLVNSSHVFVSTAVGTVRLERRRGY